MGASASEGGVGGLCRGGGPRISLTLMAYASCHVGDEMAFDVGRGRFGRSRWRMMFWIACSSSMMESPMSAPPIADADSSLLVVM